MLLRINVEVPFLLHAVQCKITKAPFLLWCKLREKSVKNVLNLQVLSYQWENKVKKQGLPGENKIMEVFKILDLMILSEGMTWFEPLDGTYACVYVPVCAYTMSSGCYRDIHCIWHPISHTLYCFAWPLLICSFWWGKLPLCHCTYMITESTRASLYNFIILRPKKLSCPNTQTFYL